MTKSIIHEAAEELEKELRPFPWFVSIGVINGTVSNLLHRELIVYTSKLPKCISYPISKSISEIPIRVEFGGRPKPLATGGHQ